MACTCRVIGILVVYPSGVPSQRMAVTSGLDLLVRTFGPFLIPATVFALGAIGYLLLWLLTRTRRQTYRAEDEKRW